MPCFPFIPPVCMDAAGVVSPYFNLAVHGTAGDNDQVQVLRVQAHP
jgi:hypothetical protein